MNIPKIIQQQIIVTKMKVTFICIGCSNQCSKEYTPSETMIWFAVFCSNKNCGASYYITPTVSFYQYQFNYEKLSFVCTPDQMTEIYKRTDNYQTQKTQSKIKGWIDLDTAKRIHNKMLTLL